MNKPIDMKKLIDKLESINETTFEQYEVMIDDAGKLGKMIAVNVLNTNSQFNSEELLASVDKHIAVAAKRMKDVARKYIDIT